MQAGFQQTRDMTGPMPVSAQSIIVGLGDTGLSCARFLAARGIDFAVVDTRDTPPGITGFADQFPGIVVLAGVDSIDAIGRCERLILSPGVPREHPLVVAALERNIEVIGDIELFARYADAPIAAVTGSNGKSTVVSMVSAILAAAGLDVRTGGNIGTPALDLLTGTTPDCYVLELSSFQLESTMTLSPRSAAVLNVSPDHMDRYAVFEDYFAAKLRIAERAGLIVINLDDAALAAVEFDAPMASISTRGAASATYTVESDAGADWLIANGDRVMPVAELTVAGEHNRLNALAAIALSDAFSVPRSAQRAALTAFGGLAHRCQTVAHYDGIEWIDDSKGTNVGASCAALASVFGQRSGVLIAGGQGKGADFAPLAEALAGRVHSIVLIGEDAQTIARVVGTSVTVQFALDMRSAVNAARALVRSGEAVLLSPACASFDMFENFAARGDAFATAVAEVIDT